MTSKVQTGLSNMSAVPFYNPIIPTVVPIVGGFLPGRMIRIQGRILKDAKSFSINLQCGPHIDNNREDVALHFNPLFKEHRIHLNSIRFAEWGTVEIIRGGLPFSQGEEFEILFYCIEPCTKIAINGAHFCDFNHRLTPKNVSHVTIDGDVEVALIGCEGKSDTQPAVRPKAQETVAEIPQPAVPLPAAAGILPQAVPGMMAAPAAVAVAQAAVAQAMQTQAIQATQAQGMQAQAQGMQTQAQGMQTQAQGMQTQAQGIQAQQHGYNASTPPTPPLPGGMRTPPGIPPPGTPPFGAPQPFGPPAQPFGPPPPQPFVSPTTPFGHPPAPGSVAPPAIGMPQAPQRGGGMAAPLIAGAAGGAVGGIIGNVVANAVNPNQQSQPSSPYLPTPSTPSTQSSAPSTIQGLTTPPVASAPAPPLPEPGMPPPPPPQPVSDQQPPDANLRGGPFDHSKYGNQDSSRSQIESSSGASQPSEIQVEQFDQDNYSEPEFDDYIVDEHGH